MTPRVFLKISRQTQNLDELETYEPQKFFLAPLCHPTNETRDLLLERTLQNKINKIVSTS
jgi:hypothetical protein